MYFSIYCCKNGCVSFLNVCDVICLYVDLNVIYMCGCMDAGQARGSVPRGYEDRAGRLCSQPHAKRLLRTGKKKGKGGKKKKKKKKKKA